MAYQTLQILSQIAIAIGLIVSAIGGFGSYYFQQKIDEEKELAQKPIIDLCHRGISVKEIEANKLLFDIPYCSGKNANAHNVKLETSVILKTGTGFVELAPFGNKFPDDITLSYETGKSISYVLHPLSYKSINNIYIAVRGTYTNESGKSKYTVFDIYKFSAAKKSWVRALGEEDVKVRSQFLKQPG